MPPVPPDSRGAPPPVRKPSIVIVNTGDGKGKSSAAFGVMLRAWARGWRVAVVQCLKSGEWNTGEHKAAEELGIDWFELGDGFTWDSENMEETARLGREAWERARGLMASGDYGLVIIDELTYVITFGWVPVEDVVEGLRGRAEKTNVIVTGRDAPQELVDLADTVTEMRNVKHAFDQGVRAMRGLDY